MTIGGAVEHSRGKLQQAGIESARLDALILLEQVTGKSRAWLETHPEAELEASQKQAFADLVAQRAQRIPLVHLTHRREFYGLDLYIDEHVLTPRVETETMVDFVIKYAPKGSRLLDVGTGSGALAVAIKKHRPDLEVWASDVSETELAVARRNATTHRTEVHFVVSDLLGSIPKRFQTIVTNLPYLRTDAELMPEVRREPGVALYGGTDGLDLYRKLLRQLPNHLGPHGYLFTECDPWQHETLIIEAASAGLTPIEHNDYFILGFQRSVGL